MKITVVVENHAKGMLDREHGLCLYIEYKGKHYLLDTGASDLYLKNGKKLGIDFANVDAAVLSHGHYDHSGGFGSFVEVNGTAPIYLRENALGANYAGKFLTSKALIRKYIGIPKKVVKKAKDRFVYVSEDTEIAPGVFVIGHHTPGLDQRGKMMNMYCRCNGKWEADDFSHEQSLVFATEEGLVILNSCSHGGADNIIREVQAVFPDKKIRAMIGGFHLMGTFGPNSMRDSEAEVEALGKRLLELQVPDIYTCHCTGIPAYEVLKKTMGEVLHEIHGGDVMEFSDTKVLQ